jgi:hypothetical protein
MVVLVQLPRACLSFVVSLGGLAGTVTGLVRPLVSLRGKLGAGSASLVIVASDRRTGHTGQYRSMSERYAHQGLPVVAVLK